MKEIHQAEYEKGTIKKESIPILLIRKIEVTKYPMKGNYYIFMDKMYQNNDKEECREIDDKLIELYENKTQFTVVCFNDNSSVTYSCVFDESPRRGQCKLASRIIN